MPEPNFTDITFDYDIDKLIELITLRDGHYFLPKLKEQIDASVFEEIESHLVSKKIRNLIESSLKRMNDELKKRCGKSKSVEENIEKLNKLMNLINRIDLFNINIICLSNLIGLNEIIEASKFNSLAYYLCYLLSEVLSIKVEIANLNKGSGIYRSIAKSFDIGMCLMIINNYKHKLKSYGDDKLYYKFKSKWMKVTAVHRDAFKKPYEEALKNHLSAQEINGFFVIKSRLMHQINPYLLLCDFATTDAQRAFMLREGLIHILETSLRDHRDRSYQSFIEKKVGSIIVSNSYPVKDIDTSEEKDWQGVNAREEYIWHRHMFYLDRLHQKTKEYLFVFQDTSMLELMDKKTLIEITQYNFSKALYQYNEFEKHINFKKQSMLNVFSKLDIHNNSIRDAAVDYQKALISLGCFISASLRPPMHFKLLKIPKELHLMVGLYVAVKSHVIDFPIFMALIDLEDRLYPDVAPQQQSSPSTAGLYSTTRTLLPAPVLDDTQYEARRFDTSPNAASGSTAAPSSSSSSMVPN